MPRFDPGLVSGNCPDCNAYVGAKTGEAVPHHQPVDRDDKGPCSGIGKPAQ